MIAETSKVILFDTNKLDAPPKKLELTHQIDGGAVGEKIFVVWEISDKDLSINTSLEIYRIANTELLGSIKLNQKIERAVIGKLNDRQIVEDSLFVVYGDHSRFVVDEIDFAFKNVPPQITSFFSLQQNTPISQDDTPFSSAEWVIYKVGVIGRVCMWIGFFLCFGLKQWTDFQFLASGKSSLVNQFINKTFSETYGSTVGVDYFSTHLYLSGKHIALQVIKSILNVLIERNY